MKLNLILLFFIPFALFSQSNFIYEVEKGDTVQIISSRFRIDESDITQLNKLSNNFLYIGQNLELPISYRYMKPISSSLDKILNTSIKDWRNPCFEVYTWDKSPSVLVFDTINYSFQSLMFKRLAFFIEKKDYIGQIYSLDEIEDERGWNGHDYKSEDLARFFNKVKLEGYELTKGEGILLDILLEKNILGRTILGYIGRGGAVISYSRSSYYNHRKTILRHEAFHGLFFTSQGFRNYVSVVWDQLDDNSKNIWILYLELLEYEISDPTLVMNEFMAYMLQLSERETYIYFNDIVYYRLIDYYPEHRKLIRDYFKNNRTPYKESIQKLNSYISKLQIDK